MEKKIRDLYMPFRAAHVVSSYNPAGTRYPAWFESMKVFHGEASSLSVRGSVDFQRIQSFTPPYIFSPKNRDLGRPAPMVGR